jgi:hypothetical protein
MIQPEEMSLLAYKHIQDYLNSAASLNISEEDLTAVLRLSQHLRVFGLLSAVGYINQTNDQDNRIRSRTVPVWRSLLSNLVLGQDQDNSVILMEAVEKMAREEPTVYMANWRKSLILANHWNFWARAYKR